MNTTGETQRYPGQLQSALTLGLLVLAFVFSYVDRQVLSLLVKPVKADLGIGDLQMSLLVGAAFALFYCGFGVPLGLLADRVKRKWLIVAGMIVWSCATMASGLASSFAALFVFRMAVGVGEAALAPASYSMLGDLFPPHRLVRATSILGLAANLSTGLALVLGGQVIAFATHLQHMPFGLDAMAPWQRTFLLIGLPGLLLAAIFTAMREPVRRGRASQTGQLASSTLRVLWHLKSDFVPVYATAGGMAMLVFGGLIWFPTHLIRVFGATPAQAGLIVGTIQITGSIIGSALGVVITEQFLKRGYTDGHLRTVMFTALGASLTVVALILPTRNLTILVWLVCVILQSTYYGNLSAALQIITPSRARGTNFAFFYLIINVLGLAGGTALIGAIAQYGFPADPRGIGYGVAIVGGGGALFAALCALLGLRRHRQAVARAD